MPIGRAENQDNCRVLFVRRSPARIATPRGAPGAATGAATGARAAVSASTSTSTSALGPASIAGIFIDLPLRALARVLPASRSAAPAGARSAPRGGYTIPGRTVAGSALLSTALEAFGGGDAAHATAGHWDEGGLGALLDDLIGGTAGGGLEILTGPRPPAATAATAATARAARAATSGARDRPRAAATRRSRLIRARTPGRVAHQGNPLAGRRAP
jgi:hypothetical protein